MSAARWLLAALAILGGSSRAHAAWVETRVSSHTATIDVDRNGLAEVSEELLLSVRGGPLKSFEIQGADPDALLEEGANATPMVRFGVPTPIPLEIARQDDGTLKIEIAREKGLFTGNYAFRFAYKTNLLSRDRVRRRGAVAEVEWIGPRFADGVDVAKVIFRLPDGASTPTLPDGRDGDDALLGSSYLAAVRHTGDKVELEVVRPHVARGEPAVWRVLTDLKSFTPLAGEANAEPDTLRHARVISSERPAERAAWLVSALLVALGYAGLVALKWRLACHDAKACGVSLRPLVGLPLGVRAALAGAFLAGAGVIGALGDSANAAAALLLAALALAWIRDPLPVTLPRGPGQWFALTADEAFARNRARTRGGWFDVSTRRGFVTLCVLLFVIVLSASRLAQHSPYHALALVLGASSLLPVWCTGRAACLPSERARTLGPSLLRLSRKLAPLGVKLVPWARIPNGGERADELRLLVRLRGALDGVSAIEIGLDQQPSAWGLLSQPFVLVRVRDGSAAHSALLARTPMQRGRRTEERVAILRPSLPLDGALAELIAELRSVLGNSAPRREQGFDETRGARSKFRARAA